jgi:hypothetical protein
MRIGWLTSRPIRSYNVKAGRESLPNLVRNSTNAVFEAVWQLVPEKNRDIFIISVWGGVVGTVKE